MNMESGSIGLNHIEQFVDEEDGFWWGLTCKQQEIYRQMTA